MRNTTYAVPVPPTLQSATCAGSPHTKTDIVDKVQRSAARFVAVDSQKMSSVTAMCANLMLNSLRTRRCIRDAVMFF